MDNPKEQIKQPRCIFELIATKKQNDWHKWLSIAEFAHNQMPNATTKKSPYDMIMGFTPKLDWQSTPSLVPGVTARLKQLKEIRNEAFENLIKAQKMMAMKHPGNRRFKSYNEGEQVWIEGTNLKTIYPSAKLAPKRYGPFKIVKRLSDAVYCVELPRHWKIHNGFHANLITPYKETEIHGPNYTRPPPDLIDGEEEYEVEQVLDMKQKGR